MRVHISLSDELVGELDRRVGSIPGEGHEWDEDPAEWVRTQRRGDDRRLG